MSFLGGSECSTGANPLAQFQKQTSADTSLQRDRLTSRTPQQQHVGFRSGQQLAEDAAFQDFVQQGPHMGEMLPNEAFHMEQLRRETEHLERVGGGGGGGAANWAGEFAQKAPVFGPEEFAQQRSGAFRPHDFAHFRQSQMTPSARTGSPNNVSYQSAYRPPPMGMYRAGMQPPMMYQQSSMGYQQPQQLPHQYEGKGKGRVQELSDTEWEKQFEELSTADTDAGLDQLDREANEAMERELNQADR
jgi:peroxin-5